MAVSEAGCRLAFFTRWSPDWCWVWPGAQMQHDARHVQDVEYRWIQTNYDWQGVLYICDYVCVKCACACMVSELVLFVPQTNVTYNIVLYRRRWFDSLLWGFVGFFACNSQLEQRKDYSGDAGNWYTVYLIHCGNNKQVGRPSTFSECWFSKDEDPFVPCQQQEIQRQESLDKLYLMFPTCFQPAEAIWARLRPSFCAEMQKAIGGKGSKWSRQSRLKEPLLTFLIPMWFPLNPHYMAFIWPSNLVFGHARKAAESAQRSREAMQQMSACKCTWRFDAAFDCPRFIVFFVFWGQQKVLVHWWVILDLLPSFTIQVVPVAKSGYIDQFA